jgi:hypothetical protein
LLLPGGDDESVNFEYVDDEKKLASRARFEYVLEGVFEARPVEDMEFRDFEILARTNDDESCHQQRWHAASGESIS